MSNPFVTFNKTGTVNPGSVINNSSQSTAISEEY
jgi:hypothetical protein